MSTSEVQVNFETTMGAFFLFLTAVIVIKSPLGRALADRLAGRFPDERQLDLEPIVHQLEDRVLDLEERLEYAERLLERQKHRPQLGADPEY